MENQFQFLKENYQLVLLMRQVKIRQRHELGEILALRFFRVLIVHFLQFFLSNKFRLLFSLYSYIIIYIYNLYLLNYKLYIMCSHARKYVLTAYMTCTYALHL